MAGQFAGVLVVNRLELRFRRLGIILPVEFRRENPVHAVNHQTRLILKIMGELLIGQYGQRNPLLFLRGFGFQGFRRPLGRFLEPLRFGHLQIFLPVLVRE
ncbi:hypothetical protein [Methylosarcina fibrata]|uniref:hypothetical protein n=1 Tax=Methylosarcina fibrata TaxID=105972 RepID=UPI001E43B8E4|nr:hypothetical protein [Methylosarcina fibrata]